jgi:hypothetical protein
MMLTKCCRGQISSTTRSKGESYFRRGQVKVVAAGEDQFKAHVSGSQSRPYSVTLDWSGGDGDVYVECSCPHYDEGNFCKHIWATLLAADESGATAPFTGRGDVSLRHRDDDPGDHEDVIEFFLDEDDDADNDEDEYDEADDSFDSASRNRLTPSPSLRLKAPRRTTADSAPSWHAQLSTLAARVRPSGRTFNAPNRGSRREKRVHFVLDVAASLHAGAAMVGLFQQEQRKDGAWGAIKPLKVRREALDQFSAEDRRALGRALGSYAGMPWGYGTPQPLHDQSFDQVSQIELIPEVYDLVLPELCATGRFGWVLTHDQPAADARPLAWDVGPPWQFRLAISDDAKRKAWRVRGELFRDDSVAPLSDPVIVFFNGLVVFPDRIARMAVLDDPRWPLLLRARDEVTVPYVDREKLLEQVWAAGEPMAAALPPALQMDVQRVAPRGVLRVHAAPDRKKLPAYHTQDLLYASVGVDYDGAHAPADDARAALVDAARGRALVRDWTAEQALATRLSELRIQPKQRYYYFDPPGHVQFPRPKFAEIVTALIDEGWRVEAEDRVIKRPGEFRASVSSGVDWFDVETAIDFDGASASLPQLLAALQRNERFVELDDGSQGILPTEWLERFAPLAELATIDGGKLRFRPSQALLLDSLLADRAGHVQIEVDRQFSRIREKLRSFAGVTPRDAPPGFQGELRQYQKQGLGWLAFLAEFGLGGCLADDMGLGKTVQVLAWLVARRRSRRRNEEKRPTLVVCPKSVVFNWQLEAERFAPKLKTLNYTGVGRRNVAETIAEADLVLTTYGTLRKDVESLKEVPFEYVVLDEAQAIKNDQSVSAKACRLLNARHRLALTGTPVENHLGDLWSLFEFLNPGMLGRSGALRAFTRWTSGAGNAPTPTRPRRWPP